MHTYYKAATKVVQVESNTKKNLFFIWHPHPSKLFFSKKNGLLCILY